MNTSDNLPEYMLGIDLGRPGYEQTAYTVCKTDGKKIQILHAGTFSPADDPYYDMMKVLSLGVQHMQREPDALMLDEADLCYLKMKANSCSQPFSYDSLTRVTYLGFKVLVKDKP
jgi:hypothetical protein